MMSSTCVRSTQAKRITVLGRSVKAWVRANFKPTTRNSRRSNSQQQSHRQTLFAVNQIAVATDAQDGLRTTRAWIRSLVIVMDPKAPAPRCLIPAPICPDS